MNSEWAARAENVVLAAGIGVQQQIVIGFVIIVGFALWLWRQNQVNAANNKHEVSDGSSPTTKFTDVAGCVEAVGELAEIVAYLRNPKKFERLGAKIPRGALLVGPPGTGKTLLARAVAGEAGVSFFHQTGSDFVELYVGAGAKRLREVYQSANAADQAIVFIDEIDAIGKRRAVGTTTTGSNDEQEQTLIALLNELDGFTNSNVFTIAATNRPEILDPALTRPGRLERRIEVPNPDKKAREAIFVVHTENKPLAEDVNLHDLAGRCAGTSGAGIAAIVNEAALEAARRDRDDIDASCFEHALSNILIGRARVSAEVTERDNMIVAWHEAGHAICAAVLTRSADPAMVSIVPRGQAGGITWMHGKDDQLMTIEDARAQLVVALGGRAAEEMLLDGDCTQGAQGDLASATELASSMVKRFGMTSRGLTHRNPTYIGQFDRASDEAVENLLGESMLRAREVVREYRSTLQDLVEMLLESGTVHGAPLRQLLDPISSTRGSTSTSTRTTTRHTQPDVVSKSHSNKAAPTRNERDVSRRVGRRRTRVSPLIATVGRGLIRGWNLWRGRESRPPREA